MKRCLVQFNDRRHLPALGPADGLANDGGALKSMLAAALPETGDVQQHVLEIRQSRIVGHNEPVSLAGIEPFDSAADTYGL